MCIQASIPKPLRNCLCNQFDVDTLRYSGEIACIEENLYTHIRKLGHHY